MDRRDHHREERHHKDPRAPGESGRGNRDGGSGPGPPRPPGRRPLPPSTEPSETGWREHRTGRSSLEQAHPAQLVARLGVDETYGYLRELKLHDGREPARRYGPGLAIGGLPTTLERLVRAYTAVARDGRMVERRWRLDDPLVEKRVMSEEAARLVTLFLSDPQARLPTFPRGGALEYPFGAAVKTGTSSRFRDVWAVGWTSRHLVGAWVGDPAYRPGDVASIRREHSSRSRNSCLTSDARAGSSRRSARTAGRLVRRRKTVANRRPSQHDPLAARSQPARLPRRRPQRRRQLRLGSRDRGVKREAGGGGNRQRAADKPRDALNLTRRRVERGVFSPIHDGRNRVMQSPTLGRRLQCRVRWRSKMGSHPTSHCLVALNVPSENAVPSMTIESCPPQKTT